MSKPPPYLTTDQQKMVLTALATLRMSSHDRFLLDLSSEMARRSPPITDLDLRMAIRKLLGVTPQTETEQQRGQ
jgi:hypothetical protein